MGILAVDWTAVGSVATGAAAIAAFLAILATLAGYYFQSRSDRAAKIRQNVQFLHGQQVQILPSINSGLLAIIDRQIREFRERLGSTATTSYILDQLSGDYVLFRASAMDSNLSSTAYSRMSDLWNEMNTRASDLRGALRIFSYACRVLTEEPRRVCDPGFTIGILEIMAQRGDLATLTIINSVDEFMDKLLVGQIQRAIDQFRDVSEKRIGQGSVFIGMLADGVLSLSDGKLLKLSGKRMPPPTLELLQENPLEAVSAAMRHLLPEFSEEELSPLRGVLDTWIACGPAPTVTQATGPSPK